MSEKTFITTPIGRLVSGDVYTPNTKDANGAPLVIKTGSNAGQPREEYYCAIAIAKQGESHWSQTEWGAKIYQAAVQTMGQCFDPASGQTLPHIHFAWKITDGDDQTPNTKGVAPCTREGYPGNWVLHFTNGFKPDVYNADGTQKIMEEGVIKRGYFIQVAGSVGGNNNQQNPGIFLNVSMVAFSAYGEEIKGVDASQVGFGGALPAGATAAPQQGGFNPAAPGQAPMGQAPAQQPGQAPMGQAPAQQPGQAPMGQAPMGQAPGAAPGGTPWHA